MGSAHKVNVWFQNNALRQIEHVAQCVTCGEKIKSFREPDIKLWAAAHRDPEIRHALRHNRMTGRLWQLLAQKTSSTS